MQASSKFSPSKISKSSVVCLMAPTASGKTALAYELYDTGRYELISVDSALIYRDMNIGTAKPTSHELDRYPHHLVNIMDPTQSYNVAKFVDDTEQLIDACHVKGKIPLLVGGTMMYYMALIEGLSPVPDSNDTIRAEVEEWQQSKGTEALYQYLEQVDPLSHQRLMPTDTQRITRAVQVYRQTNIALSDWQQQPKRSLAQNANQQWHILGVLPERPWLHERIGQRLDIMWQQGLVAEVIDLLEQYPLTPNLPSMRCVGYRQVLEYLVIIDHPVFEQAHLDKQQFYDIFATAKSNSSQTKLEIERFAHQQMTDKALFATRQLAKRQYTWLRRLSQPIKNQSLGLIKSKQTFETSGEQYKQLEGSVQTFKSMQLAKEFLM